MRRKEPLTYENALNRASALCAKCEQCSYDIIKKLSGWGISASDADRIIARLEELRFIDDERYANAYAHDKLSFSGWGKMKISRGLWSKRIPRDIIETAIDNIDEEEYLEVARRVMRSRVRVCPELPDSYEGRLKLLKFGVGRGFEIKTVARLISELKKEADEERERDSEDHC